MLLRHEGADSRLHDSFCRWKEQACSGNTSSALQVVLTEYPQVLALYASTPFLMCACQFVGHLAFQ